VAGRGGQWALDTSRGALKPGWRSGKRLRKKRGENVLALMQVFKNGGLRRIGEGEVPTFCSPLESPREKGHVKFGGELGTEGKQRERAKRSN